jgi:hypothetical protein
MKDEKEAQAPPKKPTTAFFLFRADETAKGNKIGAKEAGKIWGELSEEKKKPFIDAYNKAKEGYDKYMVEVEGKSPKKAGKPTGFNKIRVKAICTSQKEFKPMSQQQYKALSKILVRS